MKHGPRRGSGRTAQQMQDAPIGAIFVWCTERLGYAELLAKALGRNDLRIVRPSWLETDAYRGLNKPVVFDHDVRLTSQQNAAVDYLDIRGLLHRERP